jgi:hypothetical protein
LIICLLIYSFLCFFLFASRRISSLLEIQRFWAKNLDPGADSKAFDDQTAVISPVLEQQDVCTRCGLEFSVEENCSTACSFHGDDDGNPGEYKERVVVDEITGKEQRYKGWTCCNRTHEFAPGCAKGPHNCKEVMISIRGETAAPVRIESVEVTIIKQLEISIFPCANYFLKLQITKSLADLLHKYFSISENIPTDGSSAVDSSVGSSTNSETNSSDPGNTSLSGVTKKSRGISLPRVFKKKKDKNQEKIKDGVPPMTMTNSSPGSNPIHSERNNSMDSDSSYNSGAGTGTGGMGIGFGVTRSRQSTANDLQTTGGGDGGNNLPPIGSNSRERNVKRITLLGGTNPNNYTTGGNPSAVVSTTSAIDISSPANPDHNNPNNKQKRQECLYIVYFRVGDINVDVSTAGFGFAFNLDRFQAVMEKFFCKKQVLDWKRLIWQLEKHLVTSLIKNTATSSFSRLFMPGLARQRQSTAATFAMMESGHGPGGGGNGHGHGGHGHHSAPPGSSGSGSHAHSHGLLGGIALSPVIDPEKILNLKKSLLLGGGVKKKTKTTSGRASTSSSLGLDPTNLSGGIMGGSRRPTLYFSPNPNPNPVPVPGNNNNNNTTTSSGGGGTGDNLGSGTTSSSTAQKHLLFTEETEETEREEREKLQKFEEQQLSRPIHSSSAPAAPQSLYFNPLNPSPTAAGHNRTTPKRSTMPAMFTFSSPPPPTRTSFFPLSHPHSAEQPKKEKKFLGLF